VNRENKRGFIGRAESRAAHHWLAEFGTLTASPLAPAPAGGAGEAALVKSGAVLPVTLTIDGARSAGCDRLLSPSTRSPSGARRGRICCRC